MSEIKQEIEAISNFELKFEVVIIKLAFDNLEKMKKHQMRETLKNADVSQEMKDEILEEKFKTLTKTEAFLAQLPIWKLSYALSFICLKILAIIDDLEKYEDKSQTWFEIIENKNNC